MHFINLLTSYLKRDSGGIAIMFAFFLVPFIAATTIGIETGRVFYANTKLAYAVDAAVVAAAKYDPNDAQTNGENIFYANFPQNFMGITVTPTITVSPDEKTIQVTADSNMPTIIGKYLNVNSLHVTAAATVVRSFVGLEIALVLDTTGSMLANGKLNALKNAARNFVDIIYGNNNTRDDTAIAIVPYIQTVNVGSDKTSWLVDPAVASNPVNFPTGQAWKGCVKNRITGVGAISETPPIDGPGGQKFFTYFAESTYPEHNGSHSGRHQRWDNDWEIVNGVFQIVFFHGTLHTYGYSNIGPNLNCGDPIMPLTNHRDNLKSKISSLNVQMGGTDGSRIVWGWRNISPLWAGLWGGVPIKSYTASNNIKAIVMMTDGVNEVPRRPYRTAAVTAYETRSAFAVVGNNRLSTGGMYGATTRPTATTAINNAMAQACTDIKAQGIEIYTVVLQVNDPTTQALYQQCASSSSHYFQSNSPQDLYDHFEIIAKALNRIRITQ